MTVKPDLKQLNETMARCLAGECSPEELSKLQSILSDNPDLKAEYELVTLLFGKKKHGDLSSDKKHFEKIRDRLKNEGLM
ncbi:hypothetical protein WSM22_40250 [Cytophagales bacterium WSM2-2]|nr:hypothetical protein WSM22_40250 [Cytophagales bacterium WSM2-2]